MGVSYQRDSNQGEERPNITFSAPNDRSIPSRKTTQVDNPYRRASVMKKVQKVQKAATIRPMSFIRRLSHRPAGEYSDSAIRLSDLSYLTIENSCIKLIKADLASNISEKKTIIRYMAEHLNEVMKQPHWIDLKQDHPVLLTELIRVARPPDEIDLLSHSNSNTFRPQHADTNNRYYRKLFSIEDYPRGAGVLGAIPQSSEEDSIRGQGRYTTEPRYNQLGAIESVLAANNAFYPQQPVNPNWVGGKSFSAQDTNSVRSFEPPFFNGRKASQGGPADTFSYYEAVDQAGLQGTAYNGLNVPGQGRDQYPQASDLVGTAGKLNEPNKWPFRISPAVKQKSYIPIPNFKMTTLGKIFKKKGQPHSSRPNSLSVNHNSVNNTNSILTNPEIVVDNPGIKYKKHNDSNNDNNYNYNKHNNDYCNINNNNDNVFDNTSRADYMPSVIGSLPVPKVRPFKSLRFHLDQDTIQEFVRRPGDTPRSVSPLLERSNVNSGKPSKLTSDGRKSSKLKRSEASGFRQEPRHFLTLPSADGGRNVSDSASSSQSSRRPRGRRSPAVSDSIALRTLQPQVHPDDPAARDSYGRHSGNRMSLSPADGRHSDNRIQRSPSHGRRSFRPSSSKNLKKTSMAYQPIDVTQPLHKARSVGTHRLGSTKEKNKRKRQREIDSLIQSGQLGAAGKSIDPVAREIANTFR